MAASAARSAACMLGELCLPSKTMPPMSITRTIDWVQSVGPISTQPSRAHPATFGYNVANGSGGGAGFLRLAITSPGRAGAVLPAGVEPATTGLLGPRSDR